MARGHRNFLTELEVMELVSITKDFSCTGLRDATMILMAFYHGLRVTELINMQWFNINFKSNLVFIQRLKNGVDVNHPLVKKEAIMLKRLKKSSNSEYVFTTFYNSEERPMTRDNFSKTLRKIGDRSSIPFPIYPHMLRHSTGYYLANKGFDTRAIQAYLGHRSITNTQIYTQVNANRFKSFWE